MNPSSNAWPLRSAVSSHSITPEVPAHSAVRRLPVSDLCPAVQEEVCNHGPWLTCAHTNASVGSRTDAWSPGRRAARPRCPRSTGVLALGWFAPTSAPRGVVERGPRPCKVGRWIARVPAAVVPIPAHDFGSL
jgi:hypothetical protein